MRYMRGALASRAHPRRGEQGFVLIAVFALILVLVSLAALGLYLSSEDFRMTALRQRGAQSLYVAEGGAVVGRAALMAYMNVEPLGVTVLGPSLTPLNLATWYAGGVAAGQNPFGILDYLKTDGQKFTIGATPSTTSVTFQVNYGLATPHLKLQLAGAPTNALGGGTYHATVTLTPNPTTHASCTPPTQPCAIHQTGPNAYELFYNYTITSDGQDPSLAKRRVILTGNYSVRVQMQSFAMYLMYSDSDLGPGGEVAWATNYASYKGPIHTNGSFHFAYFPQYTDQITQGSPTALYWNNGSPVWLAQTENVVAGVRIDAPLVPPFDDPQTAKPANLTLGAPTISMPSNSFSQEGVSIGRDPSDTSAVTDSQIIAKIPELTGSASVPNGIYVPVVDGNNNCRSDDNDPMAGGIYVRGDLDSFTMSVVGNKARYRLVQGATTTTVTVDRAANKTMVTSNGWLTPPSGGGCPGVGAGPTTRTFTGVPKGWQGVGNPNATMVYVDGAINSISGTLQKNEQTTVTAAGTITITGNILYQNPPNPNDPTSNPINLLGLFSAGGDVQIGDAAPNDVQIQAVMMAGTAGSPGLSSVHVQNWGTRPVSGSVHLLGGSIGKYYGIYGVMNGNGIIIQGYGKDFVFDTRVRRGYAPPYFPTTGLFVINEGTQPLTNVRPVWREGTPP